MDKKNKEPLLKRPVTDAKQIYRDGDSYRPAGDEPMEQPLDPVTELQRGAAQMAQGITNQSRKDLQEGTRTTIGVANVQSGGNPMRQPRTRATNADSTDGAYAEFKRYFSVLRPFHPLFFAGLDLDRLDRDMAEKGHAQQMQRTYQSGVDQMDALGREYEGEAAQTLVVIYNTCRDTIEKHSDLRDNMPELTRLAVGAQQDAAANRPHNAQLRAEGAASAQKAPAPEPAPPPGTTTTVTTPAPVVAPAVNVPAPAQGTGQPRPRTKG